MTLNLQKTCKTFHSILETKVMSFCLLPILNSLNFLYSANWKTNYLLISSMNIWGCVTCVSCYTVHSDSMRRSQVGLDKQHSQQLKDSHDTLLLVQNGCECCLPYQIVTYCTHWHSRHIKVYSGTKRHQDCIAFRHSRAHLDIIIALSLSYLHLVV